MKLHNTFSNSVEEFTPIDGNKVSMYVCGPTVYDYPHLGHARCYITWDMLYRYLKFAGYDVTYCRNITDVDDKILKKAKEENIGKLKGIITLANEKTQKIGKEKKQLESSKALLDKEIDELKATIKQQANAYKTEIRTEIICGIIDFCRLDLFCVHHYVACEEYGQSV